MRGYRNEAAFSKAFCTMLKHKHWFVQRIESGETGKGIPDIYSISPSGIPVWFELKREHLIVYPNTVLTVHWRPGQQAWLHEVTKYKQRAYTIMATDNVYLAVQHDRLYKDNRITMNDCDVFTSLGDIV